MHPFTIDMAAVGTEPLKEILRAVLKVAGYVGGTSSGVRRGITHYAILSACVGEKDNRGDWHFGCEPRPLRMVFFDVDSSIHLDDVPSRVQISLPFKLDPEGVADFARRWLEVADYGAPFDNHTPCQKGWRIYNDRAHMDGSNSAVIAVAPAWILYGI